MVVGFRWFLGIDGCWLLMVVGYWWLLVIDGCWLLMVVGYWWLLVIGIGWSLVRRQRTYPHTLTLPLSCLSLCLCQRPPSNRISPTNQFFTGSFCLRRSIFPSHFRAGQKFFFSRSRLVGFVGSLLAMGSWWVRFSWCLAGGWATTRGKSARGQRGREGGVSQGEGGKREACLRRITNLRTLHA